MMKYTINNINLIKKSSIPKYLNATSDYINPFPAGRHRILTASVCSWYQLCQKLKLSNWGSSYF